VTALLDTHAILWCVAAPASLGKKARAFISRAGEGDLAISDISLLEIAMLLKKGRVRIAGSAEGFLRELSSKFRVLPVDAEIAGDAVDLALTQGDPFDRVIVACARAHRLALLTKDAAIARSGLVPVIW